MKNLTDRRFMFCIEKSTDGKKERYAFGIFPVDRMIEKDKSSTFNLKKTDVINLAKAVKMMTDERICFSDRIRKKYLSGIIFDPSKTKISLRRKNGNFDIEVEMRPNDILAEKINRKLYRITFSYVNAFGEPDEFYYVFREKDFIALGKAVCEILAAEGKDDFITM